MSNERTIYANDYGDEISIDVVRNNDGSLLYMLYVADEHGGVALHLDEREMTDMLKNMMFYRGAIERGATQAQ